MGVRFYQPGDEEQINRLFTKVFQKERSLEEWKWKFVDKPGEMNPWILVFEENNQILGHISLWVNEAYINGQPQKIGVRIDTMVDPDARGKGIYRQLNNRMIDEARNQGIHYLYGFPAEKAKVLLVKYTNGIHIGDISRYVMMLNPTKLISSKVTMFPTVSFVDNMYKRKKMKHLTVNPDIKVEQINKFDEQFDAFADSLKNVKPFIVKRTADYLNWRYVNHPVNTYEIFVAKMNRQIAGYIVVRKEERKLKNDKMVTFGYIVDYLSINDQASQALGSYTIQCLRDVDMIQAWSFNNGESDQFLERLGLTFKDKPMPFVVHDLIQNSDQFKSENHWWIMQGDLDSF